MRKTAIIILAIFLGVAIWFGVRAQTNVITLEGLVSDQERTIAEQEETIAGQASLIEEQEATIAKQQDQIEQQARGISYLEARVSEQSDKIVDLYLQIIDFETDLDTATFHLGGNMLVMPKQSSEFDCDDGALYMYLYFANLGYEVKIIAGNLDLVNESWRETNHVWVIVMSDGDSYPYDWGYHLPDEQHFEGYPVTYHELLKAATIG